MCAECHSTNYEKNFTLASRTFLQHQPRKTLLRQPNRRASTDLRLQRSMSAAKRVMSRKCACRTCQTMGTWVEQTTRLWTSEPKADCRKPDSGLRALPQSTFSHRPWVQGGRRLLRLLHKSTVNRKRLLSRRQILDEDYVHVRLSRAKCITKAFDAATVTNRIQPS